jgi:geranylgeranyl pyrophosphate synthase
MSAPAGGQRAAAMSTGPPQPWPAGTQPWLDGYRGQVAARVCALAEGLPWPLRSPVLDLAGRPGKSLRPMLVAACGRLGTPDPVRLVRLGAVVELLHLASLLHDDILDQAATRRGGPAAHTVVGRELATLAGLACFSLAGSEAADLGGAVSPLVGQAVAALSYGEILDLERAFDTMLPVSAYLELAERKTGELFRLSCVLGAAEAQAPPDVVRALARFGTHLGTAFQVLDDCLDLRASAGGKPAGTDHMLGLFGAPTLYALARDGTGELAALLLSPGFDVTEMPQARALVTAHGGLRAARRLARQQHRRALSALGDLPPGPGRDLLAYVATLAWRDHA